MTLPQNKRQFELQEGTPMGNPRQKIYSFGFILSMFAWLSLALLVVHTMTEIPIGHVMVLDIDVIEHILLIFFVAYFLYLIESLWSKDFFYLVRARHIKDVVDYIEQMKAKTPKIRWNCICYHYETRTRWETDWYTDYTQQYDAMSKSYKSVPVQKSRQVQRSYQEKVITHKETRMFQYSRFHDISGALNNGIFQFKIIKIDFDKYLEFGDNNTTRFYEAQKQNMIHVNRKRDRHFDFSEEFILEGLIGQMLAVIDTNAKPKFLHWSMYIIAALLGFSWLYRVWFDRISITGKFLFKKRLFA